MDPLEKIKRSIAAQRDDLADFILSGSPADYAAYSKAVGALQAMDMVLREVNDIEQKQLEE